MISRFNLTIATVIVAGVLLVGMAIARAAEPASQPFEITLVFRGADYDKVMRTHMVIGQPYESLDTCRVAITRVRVELKGARLQCTPANQFNPL